MCVSPRELKPDKFGLVRIVPCGQCMCCRINRTSSWNVRLLIESLSWDDVSFVTLTYDDAHLPEDKSLHKRDLQLFLKRLRKNLNGRKIKYYACGEYGSKEHTFRPHYHLIVYGLSQSMSDRQAVLDSWSFCSPVKFLDARTKGIVPANRMTMRYVAGYVQKKIIGTESDDFYGDKEKPFSIMSKGLGLEYALAHKELFENGYITLGKQQIAIPRYFRDKLNLGSMSHEDVVKKQIKYLADRGINSVEELERIYKGRNGDYHIQSLYLREIKDNLKAYGDLVLHKIKLKEEKL